MPHQGEVEASPSSPGRGRGAAVDGERERHRGLGREAKAPGLGREAAASGVGEGGSDVLCWECERERVGNEKIRVSPFIYSHLYPGQDGLFLRCPPRLMIY